jgi:hypothetical protein
MMTYEACERMRTMLAYSDHETEFRQLLQRANRANVSFYPIDARGLVVFDTPIELGVPPAVDRAWLTHRYEGLRTMALQTDGEAVLDTNDVSGAMQKVFADIGSYYLLGYYSTNAKLDGRFRRIRVEVKRDDVQGPGQARLPRADRERSARRRRVDRSAGRQTRAAPDRDPRPRCARAGARQPCRCAFRPSADAARFAPSSRSIRQPPNSLNGCPAARCGLTFEPERVTGSSSVAQPQTLTKAD